LQGYDSVALKADVELGGSDQLFNLLVGRELMRGDGLPPQVVLTGPLLEGTDAKLVDGKIVGDKMSKSLGNYVGIAEPPDDMFGKLMSISDDLMWRYYDLLSALGASEIQALKGSGENPKAIKARFAKEMVARFHSSADGEKAALEFERVHARRELPEQIEERAYPLGSAANVGLLKLMSDCGLAASNSEARRLVAQGGVSINGQKASDARASLEKGEWLLQVGKRKFLKIKID
jgi:tyrosyl-tRNA synthetase